MCSLSIMFSLDMLEGILWDMLEDILEDMLDDMLGTIFSTNDA